MKTAKVLRLLAPPAPSPKSISVQAPARLASRGWAPVYYPGEVNRCPSCGERHWRVGRVTAECAHCEMPLLIRVTGEDQQ